MQVDVASVVDKDGGKARRDGGVVGFPFVVWARQEVVKVKIGKIKNRVSK